MIRRAVAAALALQLASVAAAVGAQAQSSGAKPAPPVTGVVYRPVDPDRLLVVDTNKGRIIAELSPEAAPAHVERIRALAKAHLYDGLTFFRVIEDFMDQTGDPKNTGEGGTALPNLKGEFTFRRSTDGFVAVAQPAGGEDGFVGALPVHSQSSDLASLTKDGRVTAWGAFCPGVLGMARDSDPDSANSQFFFMRGPYPSLEKRYTAFGRVLVGQDAVRAVKVGEPVEAPQDRMTRVRLASDLPAAERPVVGREDPASATFAAEVARVRKDRGADFSVCDVTPRVKVG